MKYSTNLLTISTALFLVTGCVANPEIISSQSLPISAKAQINNHSIKLEVAKTSKQQDIGLMYRTSLPNNRGMLFEFKSARRVSFWMKNCKISLDMIFLRDGVVKAIELSAPPCTAEPCPNYSPHTAVDQVIELRGGRSAELGVKVGDRIEIEFFPQQTKF
jgi:uncharacterized membrane protein (UPF0127 family)